MEPPLYAPKRSACCRMVQPAAAATTCAVYYGPSKIFRQVAHAAVGRSNLEARARLTCQDGEVSRLRSRHPCANSSGLQAVGPCCSSPISTPRLPLQARAPINALRRLLQPEPVYIKLPTPAGIHYQVPSQQQLRQPAASCGRTHLLVV
jgi:hypothetical protein